MDRCYIATHQFHGVIIEWISLLRRVDAFGKYKDTHCMYELFIKFIEEVGVGSRLQIIIYSALVCKVAGMIVETKYPHIFWTSCIVHSLKSTLKFISLDVTRMGELINDACHILNFVHYHTNVLTIYKEYTNLSLLKVSDTWFASFIT
jgi:hypothetical protein